jgi:hypothetical protein
MWLMKLLVLVSLFGDYESFAGPRNYGFKVYKHVIKVTDISLEKPMPYPSPLDEDEMMARVNVKYFGKD